MKDGDDSGDSLGGFDIKGTLTKLAESIEKPGPYEAPTKSKDFDSEKPHWGVTAMSGGIVERQAYSWRGGSGTELRKTIDQLRAFAKDDKLTGLLVHVGDLAISLPPGLPLVRADAKRLNQIIGNVLSNAVKYTPRGGKIALEAREIDCEALPAELREGLNPKGRFALVEVRDTGVGIAPADLERIFERFYRAENPLKIEAGGTGLGLSLVRPLIELFGGRIWVRSTLGEGSTFSLAIPAA